MLHFNFVTTLHDNFELDYLQNHFDLLISSDFDLGSRSLNAKDW